uniref:Uncharacterized protein n=1 Tax=Panagrolaimus sp. JU765 TaxID=591449 RepID=A0AC34RNA3_9BILA
MNKLLSDFLHIIAYTTIVLFSHKIIYAIYRVFFVHLIAKSKDLHELAGGKWALITGSSDGIGKAYALEFAKRGFNLILISRTKSKLENVKANCLEITSGKIQVLIIEFDFAKATLDDYEKRIFEKIEKLDIGVLVNNVGQMHKYPDVFHQYPGDLAAVHGITVVNTVPVTVLTSKILPQMVKRNKGIIVNVSSAAGYYEMARWSVYSSTKKFVKHFTSCLKKEYKNSEIQIQAVCPLFLSTNMTHYSSSEAITAEDFVHSAIRTIGHTSETAGCFLHELQLFGFVFPAHFVDPFVKLLSLQQKRQVLANHYKK